MAVLPVSGSVNRARQFGCVASGRTSTTPGCGLRVRLTAELRLRVIRVLNRVPQSGLVSQSASGRVRTVARETPRKSATTRTELDPRGHLRTALGAGCWRFKSSHPDSRHLDCSRLPPGFKSSHPDPRHLDCSRMPPGFRSSHPDPLILLGS